jgi:4-oxalocrotonate tautomerase family enzyme
MPFVHIHWFEGRTDEQKAEIAKRVEAALVEVAGAAPEHCWVKFSDSKKTDFIIGEAAEDSAKSPRLGIARSSDRRSAAETISEPAAHPPADGTN